MFDIQMDGIYLDNGCLVKEAGIQPDDARDHCLSDSAGTQHIRGTGQDADKI